MEFVEVKALKSAVDVSYFPGLVHYMHIDRNSNKMTAPGLYLIGTLSVSTEMVIRLSLHKLLEYLHSMFGPSAFVVGSTLPPRFVDAWWCVDRDGAPAVVADRGSLHARV